MDVKKGEHPERLAKRDHIYDGMARSRSWLTNCATVLKLPDFGLPGKV